jgi:hypothetical protein
MRLKTRMLLALMACSLCHCQRLLAEPDEHPAQPLSGPEHATQEQTTSRVLRVSLRTSRPQATPGDSFEIAADIENISAAPLFFNPSYITMTPPPELDPLAPRDWYGTIPGQGSNYCVGAAACSEIEKAKEADKSIAQTISNLDACYHSWKKWNMFRHSDECVELQVQKDLLQNKKSFDKVVELEPGSKTTIFWNGHTRPGSSGLLSNVAAELLIPPGSYSVTIVVDYWLAYEGAQQKSTDRQSYSTVLTIPIVASQPTIMIGAVIGGLIAYFLLPASRFFVASRTTPSSKLSVVGAQAKNICASVLLSIIATILLSRLADSQFIIKVTVNDFWGAIAIGFVVTASGKRILQKIPGFGPQDDGSFAPRMEREPKNQAPQS